MFETVTPGISGHTAQAEPTAAAIAKRFSAMALNGPASRVWLRSAFVQVFGRRQSRALPRAHAAGVRKAPRHEIAAGGSAAAVPQALWGFGHGRELVAGRFARAVRVEREYNLNVTARILLNGEFTFCPIHDFNELRVARERDRQLLRDELPDNVWMSDSIAIDLDFKSLDRPSWTVFDLLVKTIIVLSRVTAFP